MHYAIGDIQGCFSSLEKLLKLIQFNPSEDVLWFTGDLVNRGPQSLETLRFVKQLDSRQQIVLGNHDLHLLAVAHGAHSTQPDDTLQSILTAPDADELIHWLRHQPLMYYDPVSQFLLVHAGLAPSWDLMTAQNLSLEVESILQSERRFEFFQHMYGNTPLQWHPELKGWDRIRCILNYFTRVRYCTPTGALSFENENKTEVLPWFKIPHRMTAQDKVIFGHWAALGGKSDWPNTYALDTGCVWGFCLTAMRLTDGKRFSVPC